MALKFNGIQIPDFVKVNSINQSVLPPVSQNTLKVNGKSGLYDFGNEIGERVIEVVVSVVATGQSDLRDKIRELADWCYTEDAQQLILADEEDKYYMAKVSGASDIEEILHVGQGTIAFICTDPYAYKINMNTATQINGDEFLVRNEATQKTYPRIHFTVTRDTTDLEIANSANIDKLIFGSPEQIDVPAFNDNPVVFKDRCSSTVGWTTADNVDDGVIQGSFYSNGYSISVQDYGDTETPTKWYGASGIKAFDRPVQDFRAEAIMGLKASQVGQLGRVELYYLDANKVQIAKQSLRIGSPNYVHPFAQVRLGSSYVLGHEEWSGVRGTYGSYKGVWDDWVEGRMAIARRGNTWSCYYTIIQDGQDVARLSDTFTVPNELATREVEYIQIHIGTHAYGGHTPVSTMYITDIEVKELNVLPTVPTDPYTPLAFTEGDTVTIDMETGMILRNGTPYYRYLDPFSKFIGIPQGQHSIQFSPSGIATGVSIHNRERWL